MPYHLSYHLSYREACSAAMPRPLMSALCAALFDVGLGLSVQNTHQLMMGPLALPTNADPRDSMIEDEGGACNNDPDLQSIQKNFDTLKYDVQKCAVRCLLSGDSCLGDCIQSTDSLTAGCSDCYVALAECSKSSCLMSCINPESDACAKCAYDQCFPGLLSCSGLSTGQLPPP